MAYSSGDWTLRKQYLTSGVLKDKVVLGCCTPEPPTMPFFPAYDGPPASMNFTSAGVADISGSNEVLSYVQLTTTLPGRIGIWAQIQASGDPVTIKLSLDDDLLTQSYFSPYIFYGTEVLPPGTYTAYLEASSVGQVYITSSTLMIVGQLT